MIEDDVIPILRVENAADAVAWYTRLGFVKESEHRFEPGLPAFVTVARGTVRLFLSEHKGDARPGGLVYLSVADIDPIAAEFGVVPEDVPWGREIELRDPDKNRIRFGAPPRGDASHGRDQAIESGSSQADRPSSVREGGARVLDAAMGATRAPESNIEIIWSDWLDAIRSGDIERLASRVTPSTTHLGVRPDLVCANGDEVVENARWSSDNLPSVEAVELIGSGDHVVLCVRAPDIGMPAGEEFQGQAFIVFTLLDGKIIEIHDYLSRREALEAAGARDVPDWR